MIAVDGAEKGQRTSQNNARNLHSHLTSATENDFFSERTRKKREKRNKINLRGGGEHRGAKGGASDAATNRNLGVLAAPGSISLAQSRAQK